MKLTFLGDIMVQNAQRKAYETQDGYDFVTPLKDIEKRFNISIEDRDISGYIELDKQYSKYLRKLK